LSREIAQDLATMQALINLTTALLRSSLAFFRNHNEQAIVELGLRQQLATYAQRRPKPKLTPLDRAFWVVLFRLWSRWKEALGTAPRRTAYMSPWQNGVAERCVGSRKREIIDHVIEFNEDHLRQLLCDYVAYYDAVRVHTVIPEGRMRSIRVERRAIEARPSPDAKVVGLPRIGGLHHRYVWQEAA
jgi:transposase InsO family protein